MRYCIHLMVTLAGSLIIDRRRGRTGRRPPLQLSIMSSLTTSQNPHKTSRGLEKKDVFRALYPAASALLMALLNSKQKDEISLPQFAAIHRLARIASGRAMALIGVNQPSALRTSNGSQIWRVGIGQTECETTIPENGRPNVVKSERNW